MVMISRFNSKTDIPVPSKVTLDGSFCDLKRKNTEEDIMREGLKYRLFRDAGLLSEMLSVGERYRMSSAGF